MLQAAELTIRLHPEDDVVIARMEIPTGTLIAKEKVSVLVTIPAGHKLAVRDIAQGNPVRRYNQIIGFATRAIKAGDHVHVHNIAMGDFARDYAFCSLQKPTEFVEPAATFLGIKREDGRVATRNDIGILTSVNCSATVARMIADYFKGRLGEYPNVDGVVALTHKTGCGMASEGEGMDVLRRTMAGYARHPNFFATQVIGLGCEANQINNLLSSQQLKRHERMHAFTIQEKGGTMKAVREGIARIARIDVLCHAGDRPRLRGKPDQQPAVLAAAQAPRAHARLHHPGEGRHDEGGARRHRAHRAHRRSLPRRRSASAARQTRSTTCCPRSSSSATSACTPSPSRRRAAR